VNRRELEKHLRSHGCHLDHHGAKHDIWINPANSKTSQVPRHKTLKKPLVRGICKTLDIPIPPGL